MPGTNQPQHGIQGLSAKLQEFARRLTSLESWQRTQVRPTWVGLAYFTGAGTGNWTSGGGGLSAGQYALDIQGMVHLRGSVSNGTTFTYSPQVNLSIATLPVGFRPVEPVLFIAPCEDSVGNFISIGVLVQPTGVISLEGVDYGYGSGGVGNNGALVYLSLDACPPFQQGN